VGYWTYYLLFIIASYVLARPPLLVGVLVFFVLRRFIPDPVVYLRTVGRISRLRREIDANPSNATARRDLAMIYLERLRPGRAAELLEEARARFPDDPELLYLSGLAYRKKGKPEEALGPLVRAVEIDPRVRLGEPFLVAGDALMDLGRYAEAVDAYERYTGACSSSVEGHVKLSRALREAGEPQESRDALDAAFKTFRQIPGYKRRRELGWYLRAQLDRAFA
jgi:tetratricopeptide (TPR) repeat protein